MSRFIWIALCIATLVAGHVAAYFIALHLGRML